MNEEDDEEEVEESSTTDASSSVLSLTTKTNHHRDHHLQQQTHTARSKLHSSHHPSTSTPVAAATAASSSSALASFAAALGRGTFHHSTSPPTNHHGNSHLSSLLGNHHGSSLELNNNSITTNGRVKNPLVPDISLYEDNSTPLPLKFSGNHHNLFKGSHQSLPGLPPLTNGTSTSSGSSNTKSGYVNCAVCGVTRFYSCVQRRYGQFTCVTCYRYFRTFLLKPKRYACPNLGSCPLNVRTRCRACWIKGCISVFSVDSRRQLIIQNNLPVRKLSSLPKSTSSSLLPPGEGGNGNGVSGGDYSSSHQQHHGYQNGGESSPVDDAMEDDEDIQASPLNGKRGEDENDEQDLGEEEREDSRDQSSSHYGSMLEPEVSLREDDGDDAGEEGDIDTTNADSNGGIESPPQSSSPVSSHQSTTSLSPPKVPPMTINKLIVTGKKVWSCGKCATCTAEDCGKCIYCLDRPKFGGPFIKKQRCIKRRCLMKIKNKGSGGGTLLTSTLLRK